MSQERMKVLEMLAAGKITAEEAEKLLDAIESTSDSSPNEEKSEEKTGSSTKKLKYFRVIVEPKDGRKEKVNIKIPLGLIKAGAKLSSMIPKSAKDKVNGALGEKGVDFNIDELNSESLDKMLNALSETCIDVDDEKEAIRICCE